MLAPNGEASFASSERVRSCRLGYVPRNAWSTRLIWGNEHEGSVEIASNALHFTFRHAPGAFRVAGLWLVAGNTCWLLAGYILSETPTAVTLNGPGWVDVAAHACIAGLTIIGATLTGLGGFRVQQLVLLEAEAIRHPVGAAGRLFVSIMLIAASAIATPAAVGINLGGGLAITAGLLTSLLIVFWLSLRVLTLPLIVVTGRLDAPRARRMLRGSAIVVLPSILISGRVVIWIFEMLAILVSDFLRDANHDSWLFAWFVAITFAVLFIVASVFYFVVVFAAVAYAYKAMRGMDKDEVAPRPRLDGDGGGG